MLEAAKSERPDDHKEFSRFMQGLWYSSLRIDELNRLRWDIAAPLRVDLSGSLPLIVFLGAQKNHADTYLPAPPEFWAMIDKPGVLRSGPVFPIPGRYGRQMKTASIGRRISDIGKAANVVVDPRSGKCDSAHDLRAACLTRIAARTTMSRTQALARPK